MAEPAAPRRSAGTPSTGRTGRQTAPGGGGTVTRNSANGYYRSNDGTNVRGSVGRNHVQGDRRNADGSRQGGSFSRKGGNFGANAYNYDPLGNGWGGGVNRNGRETTVQGNYRTPGLIPGTQERYNAQVKVNGRDTEVRGGVDLHDATGGVRLGGVNGWAGRGQAGRTVDVSPGGKTVYSSTDAVKFQGVNSRYHRSETVAIPGVGKVGYKASISRKGALVDVKTPIGRPSIGIKPPKLEVPSSSLPSVGFSAPSISFGGR